MRQKIMNTFAKHVKIMDVVKFAEKFLVTIQSDVQQNLAKNGPTMNVEIPMKRKQSP